jgi:excisionase family DNA binding protein
MAQQILTQNTAEQDRREGMPIEMGGLKLFTVTELSELLDVQERTIRRYLRDGVLKGVKFARKWYIPEEALREYFDVSGEEGEAWLQG